MSRNHQKQGALFDIVIVDEASQTGPEGLILQYVGKQCVIVQELWKTSSWFKKAECVVNRLTRSLSEATCSSDSCVGSRDCLNPEPIREDLDTERFRYVWGRFAEAGGKEIHFSKNTATVICEGFEFHDIDKVPERICAEAQKLLEFGDAVPPPDPELLVTGGRAAREAEAESAVSEDGVMELTTSVASRESEQPEARPLKLTAGRAWELA